jgi:hypothetical protein
VRMALANFEWMRELALATHVCWQDKTGPYWLTGPCRGWKLLPSSAESTDGAGCITFHACIMNAVYCALVLSVDKQWVFWRTVLSQ